MNKIIPALLTVAVLVVGGIWLSRPQTTSTTPTTAQAQTDEVSEGTPSTEPSEEGTETTPPETTPPETTPTDTDSSEPAPEESTDTTEGTDTTENTDSTTETESATTEPTEETVTEEPATNTTTTDAATTEAANEPAAEPTPPEGFTITPFLSEEPVREFTEAEQVLEEGKDYQAIIVTNKGNIRLDLFEDQTPETVNNFVFLARNHFYDGVVFHRVLQDFMAQTGDPTGTGTGGPGYQFEDEFVDTLTFDKRGILAMANSGPNTNGSQFFITFAPTEWLNGMHSIFGELVEGDNVLSNIQLIDPSQGAGSPSVIAMMSDTLQSLAGQGITLQGDPAVTLEAYLTETLGSLPEIGSEFEIDGVRAISGRMGETPAVGFFTESSETPTPDVMQAVYIIEQPKAASETEAIETEGTATEETATEETTTEETTTEESPTEETTEPTEGEQTEQPEGEQSGN
jgi:cyclophilin family peptidyl-prolyl cis-trans isomerase/FtsZ-interacting cell division protein ZipA